MADLQSMSPEEIIKHIQQAGSVETATVEALDKRLHEDWIITAEEAELLFQINQFVGDHPENCPTWKSLYVEAISRFVVMDMDTPGEVSSSEAEWLLRHISAEPSALSTAEVHLLNHIRQLASSWCPSLEPYLEQAAKLGSSAQPAPTPAEAEIDS